MGEFFDPNRLYRSSDAEMRSIASEGTLRVWRCENRGPPYVRLLPSARSPIRYRGDDLNSWLASRRVVPPQAA